MDKSKALDLSLIAWIASLKSKDRTYKSVRSNFEELFQQWKDLDASFDEVYETLLPKAIKAHLPSVSVARNTFKTLKSKIDKTEKEFIEEWHASIEGTGQDVFFEFFPPMPLDHDPEPKIYGSMSATEYKAQRRYADTFPTLSNDKLIKQWESKEEYNSDIEFISQNVLGKKSNETII